jgi:hypothetical protein
MASDVQAVAEVAQTCFKNMQVVEALYTPEPNCIKGIQKAINERMRTILVLWLVEVQNKFRLADETLFLTVNLIDRYTSRVPVKRENYQLLGVSAMWLASKYVEIHPPVVTDFTYVTDNNYTCQ